MNGYLQRLAASAMSPSRAIRPALGPVYAQQRFEAEPARSSPWDESPVETVTEQESAGPRQEPQPPKALPSMRRPAAVHAVRPRATEPEEQELQDHVEFRPLVHATPSPGSVPSSLSSAVLRPRSEGTPVSPTRPATPAAAGTEGEMPISTGVSRLGDGGAGAARRSELPDQFTFEPLIPVPAVVVSGNSAGNSAGNSDGNSDGNPAGNSASDPPGNGFQDNRPSEFRPDPAMPSQTRVENADAAQRPVTRGTGQERTLQDRSGRERNMRREPPARTQTDDVQIHIGRIEVTAVPPAAAPAVRKPNRKPLSLSEYLGRRR
jgi:hypothetical protein